LRAFDQQLQRAGVMTQAQLMEEEGFDSFIYLFSYLFSFYMHFLSSSL
jgi:hypothetical protein